VDFFRQGAWHKRLSKRLRSASYIFAPLDRSFPQRSVPPRNLFADRYDLEMRQDVVGDDAHRFQRMDARLDGQTIQDNRLAYINRRRMRTDRVEELSDQELAAFEEGIYREGETRKSPRW
jgi:hypothetical protein